MHQKQPPANVAISIGRPPPGDSFFPAAPAGAASGSISGRQAAIYTRLARNIMNF